MEKALIYDGVTIGHFDIVKKRDNGAWGVKIDIDVEKLPEDTHFQRKSGNLSSRPEVIAIKGVIKEVFTNNPEIIALYTIVPSSRPDLIRSFEATGFKRSGQMKTKDGDLVRLECVK